MPDGETGTSTSALLTAIVLKSLTAAAESWARVDLTMPQLKVLLLLGERGSVPVNWLASRMDVSPPNITGILDRLEQHHWVRRAGDPQDRRVVRIALTPEGEALLNDLSGAGVLRLQQNLDALGERDSEALRRGLAALVETFDTGQPVTGESSGSSIHIRERGTNGQVDRQADRARA